MRLVKDPDGMIVFYDGAKGGRVFERLPEKEPVPDTKNEAWLHNHGDHYLVQTKAGTTIFPKRSTPPPIESNA